MGFLATPEHIQHSSIWPQLSTPVVSVVCQVGTVQANTMRMWIHTGDALGKRSVLVIFGHFCGKPGKMFTA